MKEKEIQTCVVGVCLATEIWMDGIMLASANADRMTDDRTTKDRSVHPAPFYRLAYRHSLLPVHTVEE